MGTNDIDREIRERKERWVDFMKPDASPGFMFYVNPPKALPSEPRPVQYLWPSHKKERIEWYWKQYEEMLEQVSWLKDDKVPYVSNMTGTEIFAEALGCEVDRPDHTAPFALPFVTNAIDAEKVRIPELSESSLAYLFDIADEFQKRGGKETVLGLVDIQSPMDIAALVWNKADLFMAMYEEPDAVRQLTAKCAELLTTFMDEWFFRYGDEYVAHYPDYFMRGGITLSEDEVGAVNETMFNDFFREPLVDLSNHFGGLGIHCCANSRHQWSNFKSLPGLRLLNLCCPPDKPQSFVTDAYNFFGPKIAQMHYGWNPEGPIETWLRQYPEGTKVVFVVNTSSKDEALRACDTLNRLREEKTLEMV